jgi:hypothetical protein
MFVDRGSFLDVHWTQADSGFLVALGLTGFALVIGCSSKEPDSTVILIAPAQGGGNASGGSAGACASAVAAVVPDAWARPAQCNGVGNLCSEGCQGAACVWQGACAPSSGIGASADACTPYCLAGACMGFDDASCLCTGSAAARVPACACGPKAVVGICIPEGDSCASTPCCDCMGLTCVTEPTGPVCRQPCAQDADCATDCCNVASGVCQDARYCNCFDAGARCKWAIPDGDTGPECCPGNSCVAIGENPDGADFLCYQDCKSQADCATGCCAPFAPGSDAGYCGPCQ